MPETRDEVQRLGETLNEMLARLESALARERDFVADAGHELRTPLALLRTELELALRHAESDAELREAVRRSAEEVDRLTQLADDLLLIAGSERGKLPLRLEPVPTSRAARLGCPPLRVASGRGRPVGAGSPSRRDQGARRPDPARAGARQPGRQRAAPRRRTRAARGDAGRRRRRASRRRRGRGLSAGVPRDTPSSASRDRTRRGQAAAQDSDWRSCGRSPRPTGARRTPPTASAAAPTCGSCCRWVRPLLPGRRSRPPSPPRRSYGGAASRGGAR